MSDSATGPLRLLTFGDATAEIWGATLQAGHAAALFVVRNGATAATDGRPVELRANEHVWTVSGTGFDLQFTPVDGTHDPSPAGDGLCRVEGRVSLPDGERQIRCPGTVSVAAEAELGRFDSLRALTGWFDENRGLALRALRPDEKKGHERDVIAATLFDADHWVAVEDPRLSTTFRAGEQPARASLELWVGDGDELYPRRAAAEAVGLPSEAAGERLRLSLTPLICHAGGLDGTGVYLIAHL
ncbi:MAG: hypothetical protein QOF83_2894 [Solirubrobacteraceae bacterium]|jgi:hypothetical protein|nr:hypothetical protein [Solirubrobacteraceae bacterium]